MNKLYIISFLLLNITCAHAQIDTLQLLKGEWNYIGQMNPDVNDTSRLSKEKIHNSYIIWEFKENGNFKEYYVARLLQDDYPLDPVRVLNEATASIWKFNNKKQTVELRDISRIYKITEFNEEFLEMVRLK